MVMATSLLPLFLLLAAAAIATNLAWPEAWLPYALLKPLTTGLVIAHAWRRGGVGQVGEARRRALLLGLVLSLVGDVALLWPKQGFLPGLVAFLLAHLAYLLAFTRGVRLGAWPTAFAMYAVLAAAMLGVLWPGLPGPLRAPVVAYVVFLAAMAAQTACVWRVAGDRAGDRACGHACGHAGGHAGDRAGDPAGGQGLGVGLPLPLARGAALGGLLFLCSDALLAFNRFHTPLPAATLWILASYWAAQWLIASALPPRR